MDVILRQWWIDPRLTAPHRKGGGYHTVSSTVIKYVWVPDIIFINEVRSHIHTTTIRAPTIGIDILPNGRITYSQR